MYKYVCEYCCLLFKYLLRKGNTYSSADKKKTIGHKCYFGIIAYNYYLCLSNIVRCNVSFLYLLYLVYINKHFTANIQTV